MRAGHVLLGIAGRRACAKKRDGQCAHTILWLRAVDVERRLSIGQPERHPAMQTILHDEIQT